MGRFWYGPFELSRRESDSFAPGRLDQNSRPHRVRLALISGHALNRMARQFRAISDRTSRARADPDRNYRSAAEHGGTY